MYQPKIATLFMSIMMTSFLAASAYADSPGDTKILAGACSADSHVSEGRVGGDLTKNQKRFACDTAVITFFKENQTHAIIQFTARGSNTNSILGFAGFIAPGGLTMPVSTLYLAQGKSTPADHGECKFFFTGPALTGLFCGGVVDASGHRTVAVVTFNAPVQ